MANRKTNQSTEEVRKHLCASCNKVFECFDPEGAESEISICRKCMNFSKEGVKFLLSVFGRDGLREAIRLVKSGAPRQVMLESLAPYVDRYATRATGLSSSRPLS